MTVQRALDLGWAIADVYGAPASAPAAAPGGGSSPGVPGRPGTAAPAPLARIRDELERALGATGPALLLAAAGNTDRGGLLAAHHAVVEALGAADPALGSAYELGGLLAGIGLEPWRALPAARAQEVREALSGSRFEAARALLSELQPALPGHAARSVLGSLARWSEWLGSSGSGVGWAGSTGEKAVELLHQQALSWRSLLTGQRSAADAVSARARVAAAKRLGSALGQVEMQHLRRFVTWWGLAAVFGVGVLAALGFWLLGPLGASTVLVLGALGLYRVVNAGLGAVVERAGEALWEEQLEAEMVAAVTLTPALPPAPTAGPGEAVGQIEPALRDSPEP